MPSSPLCNTDTRARSVAVALFQDAISAGRNTLGTAELESLLAALSCPLLQDLAGVATVSTKLRVSLHYSRDFGHVISAGLGGLDGELDASHFCKGRAAAQALATMSSGEDFLQRFKQTVAWQKLLLSEQRQQRPAPDEPLILFFDRLLGY